MLPEACEINRTIAISSACSCIFFPTWLERAVRPSCWQAGHCSDELRSE